jgi:hypothetical protein
VPEAHVAPHRRARLGRSVARLRVRMAAWPARSRRALYGGETVPLARSHCRSLAPSFPPSLVRKSCSCMRMRVRARMRARHACALPRSFELIAEETRPLQRADEPASAAPVSPAPISEPQPPGARSRRRRPRTNATPTDRARAAASASVSSAAAAAPPGTPVCGMNGKGSRRKPMLKQNACCVSARSRHHIDATA